MNKLKQKLSFLNHAKVFDTILHLIVFKVKQFIFEKKRKTIALNFE